VLVLLPPSETKATPSRQGAPLDLESLSFPALTEHRAAVLDALIRLSSGPVAKAQVSLKLSAGQYEPIARNIELRAAPTMPAGRVYTGVLYDALDISSLSGTAKRRANSQLVIASALFGAVRPTDRIPAYRLAGNAKLPRLGTVGPTWRPHLDEVLPAAAGRGLVLDLRSSTYASMWQPSGALAERTVTVRVLHERRPGDPSSRMIVSHFNKATKGRLVRDLLNAASQPRNPAELAEHLAADGRVVELHDARPGKPRALDVVVLEV
jgi:cytoplasmic iron level regulating protein YaaA (DUF328/UPF0246 family)